MSFDFKVTPINKNIKDDVKEIEKFKPLVSIITPFYNSGEYIEDTAKSVLNQSFPWFEWIIIDDGSKDKYSLDVLNELEKKDKRIKVYHKKNEGLAITRDFGASKASKSSKYLVFLDDDDLIEQNYIECAFYSLETNPNACFSYTDSVGFGEMEYLWKQKFDIKKEVNQNILVATAMIRKEDFFAVGGYGTKEKGINEDWVFWLKLFSMSKIPLHLNYYGFWYRRKENGELKKSESKKNWQTTNALLNKYKDKVDFDLQAIEYPKDNYDWDDVFRVANPFKVFSKIKSKKKNIIMIMPHVVIGGADKFNIDFLKGLNNKYCVTAIFTNISDNDWLNEIKKYVDTYYILPSFIDRKYWHLFLEYLIKKNNTELIFNSNSIYGYMSLPYIKSKFNDIKILDYVHMEEWYNRNGGYSRDSSAVSSVIDKTLVCNKHSENILIDYFKRDPKEVSTVYIGVDEEKFVNDYTQEQIMAIKDKYNLPSDKKIISFIARIADQKRPFLLFEIIKAFTQKHNDSIFVICGDGPLLNILMGKIKKAKLDDFVYFLGSVKNSKEIYAISDCTLNCSIKEGLALTTYESLSMGVPIVSSNVGGQNEIIDKSVGYVIDTNQKEEDVRDYNYDKEEIFKFVKCLEQVLANNNKYKVNCRKKILNGFTIKQMNQNMNKIIANLLKNKSNKKFENNDIALELLNQYLLESKEEFKYFINYDKNGGNAIIYWTRRQYIKDLLINWLIKMHIYKEAVILYRIFRNLMGIILVPFYILKLIGQIIYRIVRIIKKLIVRS